MMARIEELPDDFDSKTELNKPAFISDEGPVDTAGPDFIDQILSTHSPSAPKTSSRDGANDASAPTAAMPPAMHSIRQYSADEVVSMLNRTPLFMTSLDETDGEGGENVELEALKALAYEGTRAEIAQNFREQGNDHAKAKNWREAKNFYDQALAALKSPHTKPLDAEEGVPDMDVVELDEEAERKKEKEIEEASRINRALCNLELKNYRACNLDCAATLRLNPSNIKAWFRSASACLSLDKIAEAEDACLRGLEVDVSNGPLKTLQAKVEKRKHHLGEVERKRIERLEKAASEKANLALALKARGIKTRKTDAAPDTEDAVLRLDDPTAPHSTLIVPVMFMYPLDAQSDFIKSFEEGHSLNDHLEYILPLPWDKMNEYASPNAVECYIESITGGLIKAGKKLQLLKILMSGKVEIVDGLLRVYVVPKAKASEWIPEFKKRNPQKK